MKIRYMLSLAIVATAMLVGCKKDFLNTEPTQFLTADQLANAARTDPKVSSGTLNGLYVNMYNTGTGGTTNHDDFGQKGYDIYMDMLSSDMVLGATVYGWYSTIARMIGNVDFTTNQTYQPWRYYYRQIRQANAIIDGVGGTNYVPTTAAEKSTIGQAKAMRAYAYFYLTQLYAKEYGSGTDKILPIYTSSNTDNQPKSTTAQVYDLMVSDLTQAISYLDGFTRATKDQVNKNVAKGLLAYVLAARGTQADWAQVATLTKDIMMAYVVTPKDQVYFGGGSSLAGFNNLAIPSWIWGVDVTVASSIGLVSWWGQVDYYTYSYAWAGDPKLIDKGLYDAIPSTDVRKSQFVQVGASTGNLQPRNKFYDPGRVAGGQRTVVTDLVYMRSDEFYLLNAEANARLGNETEAKQALTSLLSQRVTDLTYLAALTGQPLLNEIYLQTRIELWGEGKTYLAMKRNKAITVRGSNHLFFAGQSFAYNDDKLSFVIPQAEVLNNPNLNK